MESNGAYACPIYISVSQTSFSFWSPVDGEDITSMDRSSMIFQQIAHSVQYWNCLVFGEIITSLGT
jgi:hypothetical protein